MVLSRDLSSTRVPLYTPRRCVPRLEIAQSPVRLARHIMLARRGCFALLVPKARMRITVDPNPPLGGPRTALFAANPHFCDSVNRNIIRSEIEGGVHLRDLPPGSVLSIRTMNRVYRLVVLEDETALISGHPDFCPDPARVRIVGSTWGGSMLMMKYVGRGMHLEFDHPVFRIILTSRIVDIRAGESIA